MLLKHLLKEELYWKNSNKLADLSLPAFLPKNILKNFVLLWHINMPLQGRKICNSPVLLTPPLMESVKLKRCLLQVGQVSFNRLWERYGKVCCCQALRRTLNNPFLVLLFLLGCCNTNWKLPKKSSPARLHFSSHTAFSKTLCYYKLASS